MIVSTKPDVILGTDTWLSDKICTAEVFPPELGYDVIRRERERDLLLTSHPGHLSRCTTIPPLGNSDHDIVLLDFATHITRPRPKRRRTIFLWKKANIKGIREELLGRKDTFMNTNYQDVNSMWGYIR